MKNHTLTPEHPSKRSRATIALLLTLGVANLCSEATATPTDGRIELIVAPGGAADATGTIAEPLPDLAVARNKIRRIKAEWPDTDIIVYLREGTYRIEETVRFGPEDSANPGTMITYRNFEGERPVISSGIPITGWQRPVSYPESLPADAREHVWVADFPEQLEGPILTLFDGKGRLTRSLGPRHKPTVARDDPRVRDRKTLFFPEGALREYPNLQDAEIWIVPSFQWCHNLLPLETVDPVNNVARTSISGTYELAQRERGYDPSEFRVANVPDYLNAPGRWFADSRERKIWLWPRDGQEPEGVVAPALSELLLVEGDAKRIRPVRGLVFEGLTFTHNERDRMTDDDIGLQHDWEFWDKPNAMVRFRWAEQCVLRGCLITEGGGGGVRLDLHAQHNVIEENEISRLGGTGLSLVGDKIGRDYINRFNRVLNNHIHRIGLEHHHSAAVMVWQSGDNTFANNRVHHTPYNGFSIGGIAPFHFSNGWSERNPRELSRTIDWDQLDFGPMRTPGDEDVTWNEVYPLLFTRNNVFAYNELYRTMQLLGDGNAFYIRMAYPGNVVRRNFFHHNETPPIRFDGQQAGTLCEENVIYRARNAGIVFRKANVIHRNIIIDILPYVPRGDRSREDFTGADIATESGPFLNVAWGPSYPAIGVDNYMEASIRNNVMLQTRADFAEFYADTRHWKGRTPRWVSFFKIKDVDQNLFWSQKNPGQLKEWVDSFREEGLEARRVVADPMFVDIEAMDFRFREGSPALKMGIPSIDVREMGLTETFPQWLRERVYDDYDTPLIIDALD